MPGTERVARQMRSYEPEPSLERCIDAATAALLAQQRPDGHWVFELEADATISAEYVALQHFLGERDPPLEARLASYLRRLQGAHGGWPLVDGGPLNLSASVKAYFALKLVGDSPHAEHMRRARDAILAGGGAGMVNVFTRILLALHGVLSWSAVPIVPVELMLLPRWFPFHLSRVSYWTRTVLVPLLVLQALKPCARNPERVHLDERVPGSRPRAHRWARAAHQSCIPVALSAAIDVMLHWVEPLIPGRMRRRAIEQAVAFVTERLNGEDGLGAIFPAMANAVMMFEALGYPRDHDHFVIARKAVDKLLVAVGAEAYCQPFVSLVWDTGLACQAVPEIGGNTVLSA
mgnify:CR=1 FL=1